MPSTEPVVEMDEQIDGRAEPLDIRQTDAGPVCLSVAGLTARIDQPPKRGIVPRPRIGLAPRRRCLT